jgi:transcriptional regulator of acetoin/glycerol metabolism
LYYRLQGLTVSLPPLRERGDRRALVKHILARECANEAKVGIDDELLDYFDRHRWPGNIRQLCHLLRTMVALREFDVLTLDDLPPDYLEAMSALADIASDMPAAQLNSLENAERDALIAELEKHGWNISTLAKQLKMSRNTLYRKKRRLNITDPEKAEI